jgi:hypoxanthine phosphoribosyltransferase
MPQTRLPSVPEYLSWQDVDRLIDVLLPQFRGPYDALLMITRGGIVPGGLIAEALDISYVLTAAVQFPEAGSARLAWPSFLQFPDEKLLRGKRILVVDDIWANGRTLTTVKARVSGAGGSAEAAVLHFKPGSNLFRAQNPDYYGAITDRFIIYPWEVQRGPDRLDVRAPLFN